MHGASRRAAGPETRLAITLEALGCGSVRVSPEPYPQGHPSMPCRALLEMSVCVSPLAVVVWVVWIRLRSDSCSLAESDPHAARHRDEALILISTPAGRLSLFKASIVLAVA